MRYLLIRHGKTDANRLTRAAFGIEGALLNEEGMQQARDLGLLLKKRGIDLGATAVAVSELLRTRQTAEVAGFIDISTNSLLNEVNTGNPAQTLELVAHGELPKEAQQAARALLAKPPSQPVWVTHGLVIAALLVELDMSDSEHFIPSFCEVIEIDI